MAKNENKKLSVKNDAVFKMIFAKKGNEGFLKDFLSSLLETDIEEIEVAQDVMLAQKIKKDKYGILDVKAKLNKNIEVDIEIQVVDQKNIIPRTNYYMTKMISSQLVLGEAYIDAHPTIVVAILNFECFEGIDDYITDSAIVARKHREMEINEYMRFYYIELPKLRKSPKDLNNKVYQWLTFIDSEDDERIEEVMKKNDEIQKANENLELLSADKEARELAEFRESSIMEMASAIRCGKDEGLKLGLEAGRKVGLKEGIKEGLEAGKREGLKEGLETGKKERNIEIVKSMLKEKIDISIISKVTGLSKEEIEKIM